MAVTDEVPLAGVMDDAVGVDWPVLRLVARRRDVIDLDALALARTRNERAQVRAHDGFGGRRDRGDDGRRREVLRLVGIAAERGEQLALRRVHRGIERRDTTLAQRPDAEQQRAALRRRE